MKPTVAKAASRRLLFDRRYGWVFDEWKDPSEESLAGGRGMFCVVPLAKSLLKAASQSISLAATSAVKVFENPELLSSHTLQTTLGNQIEKFKCFHRLDCLVVKGNSSSVVVDDYLHTNSAAAES